LRWPQVAGDGRAGSPLTASLPSLTDADAESIAMAESATAFTTRFISSRWL
jgi:hypothetical protein